MTELLKTAKQALGLQTTDVPTADPASDSSRRNLAVVLAGNEKVEVRDIGYPKLISPQGDPCPHGVILKVVASAICGSDLHMFRYRTSAGEGMVFGHEITGLVVERGPNVEIIQLGDVVSVPFNLACGLCHTCQHGKTNLCLRLNPNPLLPGAIPGYSDMGGWKGGQAEYVMIPYADFNLLVLPRDPAVLKEHLLDLAMLADILPTGCNGAAQAGVGLGSTVYIAGAGPVGLCAAVSSFALGASKVVIGDINPDRLPLAQALGCYTIDLSDKEQSKGFMEQDGYIILESLKKICGDDLEGIDCAIDCVGYEAGEAGKTFGHGKNEPEQAYNTCLCVVNAGGRVSFPGLFLPVDPKGPDFKHKHGEHSVKLGQQFAKSVNTLGGQCPVKHYNRELMRLILNRKLPKLTATLNIQVIELGGAPKAYEIFNGGKPVKYVIDPHGITKAILKGEWVNEYEGMRGKDIYMQRREEAEQKMSENGVSVTKTKMFTS